MHGDTPVIPVLRSRGRKIRSLRPASVTQQAPSYRRPISTSQEEEEKVNHVLLPNMEPMRFTKLTASQGAVGNGNC